MSNLEHLVENGLYHLKKGVSYDDWMSIMKEDINWDHLQSKITIDDLWTICQYVDFRFQTHIEISCEYPECIFSKSSEK